MDSRTPTEALMPFSHFIINALAEKMLSKKIDIDIDIDIDADITRLV
jgi:hypothetical protein